MSPRGDMRADIKFDAPYYAKNAYCTQLLLELALKNLR